MQDALEYDAHRRIVHRIWNLNPAAESFQPPKQQNKSGDTNVQISKEHMPKRQEDSNIPNYKDSKCTTREHQQK